MNFVEVSKRLRLAVGDCLPGTRIYRKDAPEDESPFWSEAIFDVIGPCLSPGGAASFVGVSRAAVHKRLKEGSLTGFFFYSTKARRSLFGAEKMKRELSIAYIPLAECKEWRDELQQRAVENGLITRGELEDAKPDWLGTFAEWDSSFAKKRLKGGGR